MFQSGLLPESGVIRLYPDTKWSPLFVARICEKDAESAIKSGPHHSVGKLGGARFPAGNGRFSEGVARDG